MKHASIRIKDLKSTNDCDIAVEQIEGDYKNITGGYSAWISGKQTFLTKAAQNKVDAINNKYYQLAERKK